MIAGGMLLWGYVVEILLAAFLHGLLLLIVGLSPLATVVGNYWMALSAMAAMLFAAGIAALIYVAQSFNSDFGKYMRYRKADRHYLRAFEFQTLVFLLAGILPVGTLFTSNRGFIHLVSLSFLYALVNGISLVHNMVGLVSLNQKFQFDQAVVASPRDSEKNNG